MKTVVGLIGAAHGPRGTDKIAGDRDRALAELSRRHRDAGWIDADYALVPADDFQGLIIVPEALPRVLWSFYKAFRTMRLRLALGGGDAAPAADTGALPGQPATGEALSLAREMRNQLGERRHGAGQSRIGVAWNDAGVEAGLNAALRLLDRLVADITHKQWEVIALYEQTPRQREVASRLGKSGSTISRSLAAARYWEIRTSIEDLERFLKNCINKYKNNNLHEKTHLWL